MPLTAPLARILALLADGEERSAAGLSASGARKSPAKLQPILRQLEEAGWVSCRRGVAARPGQPGRAVFRITIGGKRALREHQADEAQKRTAGTTLRRRRRRRTTTAGESDAAEAARRSPRS